jgi:tetratricopeptide (TPR) repeat protein
MAYCSWQGLFVSLFGEDHFDAASKIELLVELAEKSNSPFMMLVFNAAKANVMLGIQDYEKAVMSSQKALKAIEGKSIRTGHVANVYYDLALAELRTENKEQARQHYEEGRSLAKLAPNWWEPRYDFLEGMVLETERSPDYNKVKECLKKSIQGDENVGAIVPAAQTRFYLAKVLAKEGDADSSHEIFNELSNKFKSWEIPIWQKKCQQELEPYSFSNL